VVDIGPVCRFFASDERILTPLRAIYEDDAFLIKDKLIFKQPGAKGFALHQDYIGWPGFPESFVTVILAIDAANAENGATEVFSAGHAQGCLSPRDGDYHPLAVDRVDEARRVLLEMQPGDLALFGGYMPHRSAPNYSRTTRRQLYLSYSAGRD